MKNLKRKFRKALSVASLGALCCVQSVNINAENRLDLGIEFFLNLSQTIKKRMFEDFGNTTTIQQKFSTGDIVHVHRSDYHDTDDKKATYFTVWYYDTISKKQLKFAMVKDSTTQYVYILPDSTELLTLLQLYYSSFPSEWNPSADSKNERKCWEKTDEFIKCFKDYATSKKNVKKDPDVDKYGLTPVQKGLIGLGITAVVGVAAVWAASTIIKSVGDAGGNIIHGKKTPSVVIKNIR